MQRSDDRSPETLRPVTISTGIQKDPHGSVQIALGQTIVLCAATILDRVPPWMQGKGRGWITAEYAMLPGAVPDRASRKPDGRSREIQRLIGRSLRAACDLSLLGERSITVDCDVLQADAGTRVAAITGGFVALCLAINHLHQKQALSDQPIIRSVAAVSCALVDGACMVDPDYQEDRNAEVDMNFVMTGAGHFVEIQGTAEGKPFDEKQLSLMTALARKGIDQLTRHQQDALRLAGVQSFPSSS